MSLNCKEEERKQWNKEDDWNRYQRMQYEQEKLQEWKRSSVFYFASQEVHQEHFVTHLHREMVLFRSARLLS